LGSFGNEYSLPNACGNPLAQLSSDRENRAQKKIILIALTQAARLSL
jgi:hypothetical protein